MKTLAIGRFLPYSRQFSIKSNDVSICQKNLDCERKPEHKISPGKSDPMKRCIIEPRHKKTCFACMRK